MMKRTAFASRSNRFAQAWPNRATGATLPNGSSRRKSEAQISLPYTFIGHSRHRDPIKQSHAPTSDSSSPSPENRPTINTHRPPWATA